MMKINFLSSDINEFSFKNSDVFFVNDVLHYLSLENQKNILEKCCQNLNSNGIIIIRDGVSDYIERHKKTILTEFLSTKILNFNKKNQELCFFAINDIKNFASKNNLSFEMIDHSKKTSNVLFVLKKGNNNE